MSSKIYVLDGALLECNMGLNPAKLLVTENKKVKIQGKFKATDADVQVPQTFGTCKLKPTSGGYLPCIPGLQKWTKTSQKGKLGSKKFLFDCSQTMCSTGGMVKVKEPMQVNLMGSMQEQFKEIAMLIPGAMLGNTKIPRIVEQYWMDENGEKKINKEIYGNKVAMFVHTANVDAGETLTTKIKEKNKKKIDGKQTTLTYSGTVQEDGTAKLELIETLEDWNK